MGFPIAVTGFSLFPFYCPEGKKEITVADYGNGRINGATEIYQTWNFSKGMMRSTA
jgi:hypothetical protein